MRKPKQSCSDYVTPASNEPTAWLVRRFPESGLFITTLGGVKLARLGDGCLYFWDKKARREVSIHIGQLEHLAK